MTAELVVIGAGGFGRETLDVIEAINTSADRPSFFVLGVVDDAPGTVAIERLTDRGLPWLGTIDDWLASAASEQHVIAIGNPAARAAVGRRLDSAGRIPALALVHPAASLGSRVTLGAGTVVCAGTQVSTNVTAGRHTHLNPNSTIGHDAVLGECVSINPGAIISGEVTVENNSLVGAGAVVLRGLRVGAAATIGAAACVTKDVAGDSVVKGVPAR